MELIINEGKKTDAKSKKLSITSVVAVLCITIYIAAIAFGTVRIIVNIGERRNLAEREFYDLTDRASAAAVSLGFMSQAYEESIRSFLTSSETLLGIIITGSSSDFAFERAAGSGIVWAGDSPRFKPRFLGKPFYLPLRIEGQRNVTIQAVYSYIDNNLFLGVLRTALLAVLCALAVAFISLLLELIQKNKTALYRTAQVFSGSDAPAGSAGDEAIMPLQEDPIPQPDSRLISEEEHPQGLYTPRGNIGWESYTKDRLDSELHRCASFEHDLVFLVMELGEINNDSLYRQFTDEVVNFFSMRDLVFERGETGLSVIIPNVNLEEGINKSETLRSRIISRLPESFVGRSALRIGLSSRSGRLIEAGRMLLEAEAALNKTLEEPVSYLVAFKCDPEKYREFVKGQ